MPAFEMYFETFNDVSEYVSPPPPLPQKKAYSCFGGAKVPLGTKNKGINGGKGCEWRKLSLSPSFLIPFWFQF